MTLYRTSIVPSDLMKVGDAVAWPERPDVGSFVQINSGGSKLTIVRFDHDNAIVHAADEIEFSINWRCLRPWTIQ